MSKWANCSFFWANRSFAHFFANKQEFAQKTDERIPNPDVHCTVWYSILLLTEILEYAWHRGEGNLEPVGAVIFYPWSRTLLYLSLSTFLFLKVVANENGFNCPCYDSTKAHARCCAVVLCSVVCCCAVLYSVLLCCVVRCAVVLYSVLLCCCVVCCIVLLCCCSE